jgi:hypothetical protein
VQEAGIIQVLVTDLRMPRMSGGPARPTGTKSLSASRVVVLAALPSENALAWPALVKPFPAGVLEAEIQRALAGPDARAGSGEYAPWGH